MTGQTSRDDYMLPEIHGSITRMNKTLIHKKILLGVSGGIAAYKVAELIRLLLNAGAEVQVVMTAHAKQFITPLTLEILSQKPVYDDLFAQDFESNIGHIELARWPDIIMIVPASANIIAKIAHGIADDLLTTLCLATSAPLVIAPAMNQRMWQNPATQDNIKSLRTRGVDIIHPAHGEQACGDVGIGCLVAPTLLCSWLENFFSKPVMSSRKVVITAGPTQEAIDPVRYLSNYSSGKMGYALAEAMSQSGAEVVLISGPTSLECPPHVKIIRVTSAGEMHEAVMQSLPCDLFIGAAAVADYRPEFIASNKIKRLSENYSLQLVKNPDILLSVANFHPRPFVVGFCAETENHLENAQKKLRQKNLDMILMNAVENGEVFNSDFNEVVILTKDSELKLPRLTKKEIAFQLVNIILNYHSVDV
jgi:phosphopantothenoylcysteine decarboxylase / phosphopantothenate---cysteine ligase